MKKKLIPIIILVIATILLVIYVNRNTSNTQNELTCQVEGCNNPCVKYNFAHSTYYSEVCEEHMCIEDGCYYEKDEDSDFCTYHKSLHDKDIQLTENQIINARKLADDYCEKIMQKQTYIKAINIINDTPETNSLYIKYRCNVVREDSDINPATIYFTINDDGTFDIEKLEYDKEDK